MRVERFAVVLASVLLALAPASGTRAEQDWHALARQSTDKLSEALDDAARGRPPDPKLRDALRGFDLLLESAPLTDRDRARVLYNRAVTHRALGDPASAIIDLRQSDALAPGRSRTLRELDVARDRLRATTPTSDRAGTTASATDAGPADTAGGNQPPKAAADSEEFTAFVRALLLRLPTTIAWSVALGAAATAWTLLTLRLFVRSGISRRWLAGSALAGFLVALASIGLLVGREQFVPRHRGVVVTTACAPRLGPDDVAYPQASLGGHALLQRGTELEVIEARGLAERPDVIAWLRVRLLDASVHPGATGGDDSAGTAWIPATAAAWVGPAPSAPYGPRRASPVPAHEEPATDQASPNSSSTNART